MINPAITQKVFLFMDLSKMKKEELEKGVRFLRGNCLLRGVGYLFDHFVYFMKR